MNPTTLQWSIEALTAIGVVCGAAFAAIGSFGLVRLPDFFSRIHSPTLGATGGVWSMSVATIIYFSAQERQFFLHALLITLFVGLTAPVTTIFLARAALFRERQKGGRVPPAVGRSEPVAASAAPAGSADRDRGP